MPIRWRLTLWFVLILLAISVFSGIIMSILMQRYLYSDVDSNLETYSARVHGTMNAEDLQGILDYNVVHSKLPTINAFSSPGVYLQLIDTSGKVVVSSDNLTNQELPINAALLQIAANGGTHFHTVTTGENINVRIMTSPLYMQDQMLVLEVAQSLKTVDHSLEQFRLVMVAGIVSALFITAGLGFLLVRRALEPVERITDTALSIEQNSDLSRKVGYTGPADEIGRLATTFDHMIGRLNKLFESQKQFVSDASHDLRTPLTVIRGNADLLKRDIGAKERERALGVIDSEAQRMSEIIRDLLILAEVDAGRIRKAENISLKDIITEEIMRSQAMAGKRTINLGVLDDLVIKGDAYRLKQLLGNLLENAVKYSREEGTITVSLFRDGGWARLEVADNGIGIAIEDQSHIFDRFYRVDKSRSRNQGSIGLGLAIVKGIAEQHGGQVKVVSELGKGSTFIVLLKL